MRLPDAIGIGSRRCGSSWVHAALNVHPQIGKPRNGLHFFSENFDKGIDWYAGELAPFADRPSLVEFSVSYLYPEHNEAAAARMAEIVPDARTFACVRDPVDRAFSDYLRSIRRSEYPADLPFEAALERDPVLIERGRFGRLLRPYYERFGAGRICVLFYDDLAADAETYVGRLTDFLGLSQPVPPQALERREAKGSTLRSEAMNRLILGAKKAADAGAGLLGLGDRWSDWKGRHMKTYEGVLDMNRKQAALSAATERRLRAEFSGDISELEAMTGRTLDAWRHGR